MSDTQPTIEDRIGSLEETRATELPALAARIGALETTTGLQAKELPALADRITALEGIWTGIATGQNTLKADAVAKLNGLISLLEKHGIREDPDTTPAYLTATSGNSANAADWTQAGDGTDYPR
jgi:hypothetical protein